MKHILIFLLLFLSFSIYGQSINRIEVNGVLFSKSNDVEAVTVFNSSSNSGTITNKDGTFKLQVTLNDTIEISALQFQTVTVIIDAEIIESKQLKIHLVEQVNTLDAVTLSSGLTGYIETDISDVKTIKPILLDMGNMNVDFEYHDEKAFDNSVIQNHLTSIIDPNARQYMPDILAIVGLFTKSNKKIKAAKDIFVGYKYEKPKDIFSVFSLNEIQEIIEISDEQIQTFIAFIENNGINTKFLEPENKILLIEFLVKQKQVFLNHQDVKD